MNEKQIKAFVSFLSDNNVSLNDMYQALSGPKPGDIYFTDNSYFAYPLPGRTAKGVFVTSNCYVTNSRSWAIPRQRFFVFSTASRCRVHRKPTV